MDLLRIHMRVISHITPRSKSKVPENRLHLQHRQLLLSFVKRNSGLGRKNWRSWNYGTFHSLTMRDHKVYDKIGTRIALSLSESCHTRELSSWMRLFSKNTKGPGASVCMSSYRTIWPMWYCKLLISCKLKVYKTPIPARPFDYSTNLFCYAILQTISSCCVRCTVTIHPWSPFWKNPFCHFGKWQSLAPGRCSMEYTDTWETIQIHS